MPVHGKRYSGERGKLIMQSFLEKTFTPQFPLRVGNLQTFAEADEELEEDKDKKGANENDDSLTNNQDDKTPSFEELLKNPDFKTSYEAQLQKNLNQRMKKFADVDVDEYKILKGKQKEIDDSNLTEVEKLKAEIALKDATIQSVEQREKQIAVKEFAIEKGYNPKLLARLVNLDKVKKGDDGWEGIEENVTSIIEEFPESFQKSQEDDADTSNKSGKTYVSPRQKGNSSTKVNSYDAGKARAEARHKK